MCILVLAAGKGTRFKSHRVKVLHELMGKPMLSWILESVSGLDPEKVYVVVGCQKEEVKREINRKDVAFVHQAEQLGTANAVLAAKDAIKTDLDKDILIINGDLPLLRAETLKALVGKHKREKNDLTFMSAEMENPTGFGRLIFDKEGKVKIVEEREATPEQKKIKEANVGIYVFNAGALLKTLPAISNDNKKGEYYLTDAVEILSQKGSRVGVFQTESPEEIVGVNDRFELASAARKLRLRKIKMLAEEGITFYDPESTWIGEDVKIGMDSVVYPSVVIEGKTVIGKECVLSPSVHIMDSHIGDGVKILSSTVIQESLIEDHVKVGPFAHLRPETVLKKGSKVGNFVEMKKTVFGEKSKAGHLSYLGDSIVGKEVNIGAGTITCNYDGKKKHRTVIEDGAFIGSGVELVAPVKIGKNAYIGAGSTITKDVPPYSLAVSRSPQKQRKDWGRKRRKD
ncbi:MAG: bifunctional UDP-N-acetylglucosamine diphosphorylase/glucosamine-1-phosphate N-acetyltransferase GlmU [Candidatus Aminicenantes bacterium]|nr:bifunctional UDP-N-acetylglucosamine diphosphorylase/glucosamine-1-phosphate N-acetyltransferase GlmU [Candidatus Aminicenantes bacterium]